MILTAIMGVSATSIFAQDDCDTIYADFQKVYKGGLEDKKKALELAKKYLATEACKTPATVDIVKFLEGQATKLPVAIKALEDKAIFDSFNAGVPAKNWDASFSSGKQIINQYPDKSMDVMLVLASIGFDLASDKTAPNDKFNGDTLNLSKTLIQKLEANTPSESGNYGAFNYVYKNKDWPDGRANALGWMNYNVGFIMSERQKDKKGALPYLYKATQANSATKNFAAIYVSIGSWYVDEFNRIGVDRKKLEDANGGKPNDESLGLWDLQRGYLDRAIDAYSRAYKVADPTAKQYRDALYKRAKDLYTVRFENDPDSKEKLPLADKAIAEAPTKPFPDPTTEVTPVKDPTPTTTGGAEANTTGTTGAATNGAKTTTPTTPAKKPNQK